MNTCSCMAALWQLMTLFCKSLRDCSRYTKEGPAQGSDLPRSLHNLGSLLSHWPNRRRKSTKSGGTMVMKWLGQDWVHHEFLIRLVLLAISQQSGTVCDIIQIGCKSCGYCASLFCCFRVRRRTDEQKEECEIRLFSLQVQVYKEMHQCMIQNNTFEHTFYKFLSKMWPTNI